MKGSSTSLSGPECEGHTWIVLENLFPCGQNNFWCIHHSPTHRLIACENDYAGPWTGEEVSSENLFHSKGVALPSIDIYLYEFSRPSPGRTEETSKHTSIYNGLQVSLESTQNANDIHLLIFSIAAIIRSRMLSIEARILGETSFLREDCYVPG